MNLVGRQMQRTGGTTTTSSSSNDFIEIPSKWLQSAALPQDYMMYGAEGGGGGGMKWNDKSNNNNNSRNMQRSMITGGGGISSNEEFPLDPPSPPNAARLMALRRAGAGDAAFSPREYSPGLLDLNSLDTELIPEMSANGVFDEPSLNQTARGKNLDDSEPYPAASRNANRSNSVAKIKVVVRKRPLNKKEIAKKEDDIITTETNSTALTVHETKLKVDLTEYVERHGFVFDAVLDENVSNDEVYAKTVEPVVPLIFQKTKATCFAYGQTGSGKTYTMQPLPLRASRDILRLMHHTYRNQGYQLFVSFFEIYGGKLYDLLNDRKFLCMREDGKKQVCIVGLQEYKVSDTETILDLIQKGNGCRSTGTTGANEESSRSHAILQLVIKRSVDATDSKPPRVVGKLSFIDLAGSERGADTTDNDKQTRMEGAEINKSLLALKECIRALDNDQNHIPFRGSKLTEVLRDSFVGNSRTVMISCISPNAGSCEHTLNTLRYADRVKSLSKGNSKRDVSSSAPKDSQTLSSSSPLGPTLEESSHDDLSGSDRFGWSREYERETPQSPSIERVRSGRADNSSAFQYQAGGLVDMSPDDYIYSEDIIEQESPSWMKNRSGEIHQMPAVETRARKNDLQSKLKDLTEFRTNYASSDDDLNTLLKEEEDLVTAHRRLVEETIEIVREEMNMLVDADQPGNQLDDYISKLNSILSQKAAGILKLQNRLANFKRRLNEHNVLISASGQ